MSDADSEYRYGEMFEQSMRHKRIIDRSLKAMAGITVAAGSLNVFIAEENRLLYTGVPYLGAAALLCISEGVNYLFDKIQDDVIELGTRSFLEDDRESD